MEGLEDYLKKLGPYQLYYLAIVFLPMGHSAIVTLLFTFSGAVPKVRCCVPEFENCTDTSKLRYNVKQLQNASQWYFEGDGGLCHYCPQGSNRNWNSTCNKHNSQKCDHGHVFDTSVYTSTVATKFDMVCENEWERELLISLFMAGVLIGVFFCGFLSDRFGRRPVLLGNMMLAIFFYNVVPFAPNYYVFAVLQVINGALQANYFLCSFILIMELVSGKWRTVFGMVAQSYFSIGYVYVGVAAYFIRDWRILTWACSAPTILFLPYFWLVNESYRWLAANGRVEEAKRIIERISVVNGLHIPEEVIDAEMLAAQKRPEEEERKENALDLFRPARMASNTLIVFFTWFVSSTAYYGLSLNTGDLPGNVFVNFITSGLVEIPAYVMTVPMLELLGRRPSFFLLWTVGGSCCIASGLLPKSNHLMETLVTVFAMVGKIGVAGAFAVVYNYSVEIFPTVVRNTGTGLASVFARVGSILAPQIHLLANYVALWLPIVIYGSLAIAAAFLDLFLPETKGKELPETVQDTLNLSKKTPKNTAETGERGVEKGINGTAVKEARRRKRRDYKSQQHRVTDASGIAVSKVQFQRPRSDSVNSYSTAYSSF